MWWRLEPPPTCRRQQAECSRSPNDRSQSLIAPLRQMHRFEIQLFAMQFRRPTFALKFPCEDDGVVFVVTERLTLGRLMLLAKMCTGGFVALQCVNSHQLSEFEKIRDAPGSFQRLVIIFFVAGDAHVAPEFVAQFRDFSERFAQPVFATRHSAFIPEKQTEFPMERIWRARAVDLQ